ncbi:hypothetical protein E4U59_001016, partial [Claviceps monticola]
DEEVKRYIKYHERFAHLGPEKIRNLHQVTTLEKKKEQWENDDAKALPIIMKGLGSEDAIFADSSETSAELWRQLKAKYEVTCNSTANEYITKLQNFTFKNRFF